MILSREQLENMAVAVLKDFRQVTGIDTFFTPIDQVARDYLNLEVVFEHLSSDGSFCGITAFDDTELKIEVDGTERTLHIKRNQVVLDSGFIKIGQVRKLCGRRRFTLAHEIAHQILFAMESDEAKAKYRKTYATRKAAAITEIRTPEDWNEWQANVLGAAILMPWDRVQDFMQSYKPANGVCKYSTYVVNEFCEQFAVSRVAASIRLRELNLMREPRRIEKAVSYG